MSSLSLQISPEPLLQPCEWQEQPIQDHSPCWSCHPGWPLLGLESSLAECQDASKCSIWECSISGLHQSDLSKENMSVNCHGLRPFFHISGSCGWLSLCSCSNIVFVPKLYLHSGTSSCASQPHRGRCLVFLRMICKHPQRRQPPDHCGDYCNTFHAFESVQKLPWTQNGTAILLVGNCTINICPVA